MINVLLALMVRYSKLTAEEAEKLSDELALSIMPTRYRDAEKLLQKVLDKIK